MFAALFGSVEISAIHLLFFDAKRYSNSLVRIDVAIRYRRNLLQSFTEGDSCEMEETVKPFQDLPVVRRQRMNWFPGIPVALMMTKNIIINELLEGIHVIM